MPQSISPAAPSTASSHQKEERIRALIELALTYTIQRAIRHAQSYSPHEVDELHDHLADDYYEKLVQLGKIKTL